MHTQTESNNIPKLNIIYDNNALVHSGVEVPGVDALFTLARNASNHPDNLLVA